MFVYTDGAGREWPITDTQVVRIRRTRNWICQGCDTPVTIFDLVTESAALPRIGGDSANGYEAWHHNCLEAL